MTKQLTIKKLTSTEISITDETSLTKATKALSQMNLVLDALTKERKKASEKYKIALDKIKDKYAPMENALKASIASLRAQMSEYQTYVINEQQRALQASTDDIKTPEDLDSAINTLLVDKPVEKIQTTAGSVSFRPTPTLKIISSSDIPDEYWDLNESRLLADLKAGKVIPGAEIEIVQVPVNRR